MTKEEYKNYLDECKSKLTNKDKNSLSKELEKLKTKQLYWLKKSQITVVSESDEEFLQYAESKSSEIDSRIRDICYLLDINYYTLDYES